MATNKGIEESLNDVFVKNAPLQLPSSFKKFLVDIAPWATLLIGVLYVLNAWSVYQWARVSTAFVDFANQLNTLYGVPTVSTSRWTLWVYITLGVVITLAILAFMAFPGLRDRKKVGWNFLYYAAWVNVVYGVVSAFSDYGAGVTSLFFSLIGTVIGLYFLFQIRSSYNGSRTASKTSANK